MRPVHAFGWKVLGGFPMSTGASGSEGITISFVGAVFGAGGGFLVT